MSIMKLVIQLNNAPTHFQHYASSPPNQSACPQPDKDDMWTNEKAAGLEKLDRATDSEPQVIRTVLFWSL